mgnify:CR=1 FL=1
MLQVHTHTMQHHRVNYRLKQSAFGLRALLIGALVLINLGVAVSVLRLG